VSGFVSGSFAGNRVNSSEEEAMPVEVHLAIPDRRAWSRLKACPAIQRAVAPGEHPTRLDVTELALAENCYGDAVLDPEDVAFLAREGVDPALGIDDVRVPTGERAALACEMRAPFVAWIGRVARETGTALEIRYLHERGDWPYEQATWTFLPFEALGWVDYDGGSTPVCRGSARRGGC
jgi:hypothetical protein